MDVKQRIDDILVMFDEMGFEPTTLLPDYERARRGWRKALVTAIAEMDKESEALRRTIKELQEKNTDVKRTNEAIKKTREQEIKEIMLDIPQKIVAYDGNPAGQHLYGEQRQQIAEAIYKADYRKIGTIERRTAKNIADWIAFRSLHGGYPVQNILSELSDLIKRNYRVEEVKNNE